MKHLATSSEVVAFWREAGPSKWFSKDDAFDQSCRDRFLPTYEAAARGDLNEWELTPEGALAVILLLDQFPRNMFRGDRSHLQDRSGGADCSGSCHRARLRPSGRPSAPALFLPSLHAFREPCRSTKARSVSTRTLGDPESIKFAHHHRRHRRQFRPLPTSQCHPRPRIDAGRNRLPGAKRLPGLTSHSFRAAGHGRDAGAGDLHETDRRHQLDEALDLLRRRR